MRNVTILLAAVAVLALCMPAHAIIRNSYNWQGADQATWHDKANWKDADVTRWPGEPPLPSDTEDNARLTGSNVAVISQDVDKIHKLEIGNWGEGHVKITGGTLKIDYSVTLGYNATTTAATLEQTGGKIDFWGSGNFLIASTNSTDPNNKKGNGLYTISGGELCVRNGKTFKIGDYRDGALGGEFYIKGAKAGMVINVSQCSLRKVGTLRLQLTDTGTITKLNCTQDSSSVEGELILDSHLYTTPSESDDPITIWQVPAGKTITLTSDFTFSPDDSDWKYQLADSNTKLQLYYVPEPATLALLGLGGIGVLLRRRRK